MTSRKTSCKSCGAEIVWAKTRNDRAMPLDAKPDKNGKMGLVDGLTFVAGEAFRGLTYTSHFATCPQAAQHRRRA